jgi:hypothetical protein
MPLTASSRNKKGRKCELAASKRIQRFYKSNKRNPILSRFAAHVQDYLRRRWFSRQPCCPARVPGGALAALLFVLALSWHLCEHEFGFILCISDYF